MDYFQAAILSVVEGLSEFLPISSTGHMILASRLMGIDQSDFVKSFEIIIQVGAILAVVFLYWEKLFIKRAVWKQILAAFIPTSVIGFILFKFIKGYLLGNTLVTLAALFIGGIAIIVLEMLYKEKEHHADTIEQLTVKQAFLIGVFQSISVIPGVSRAAATIIGGLFVGAKRKAAVEFSFLIASPTLLAASSLDIAKSNFNFSTNEYIVLIIGLVGSFIVAVFTMQFFLKFIKNNTFIPFGVYRIIVAILFWLFIVK